MHGVIGWKINLAKDFVIVLCAEKPDLPKEIMDSHKNYIFGLFFCRSNGNKSFDASIKITAKKQ